MGIIMSVNKRCTFVKTESRKKRVWKRVSQCSFQSVPASLLGRLSPSVEQKALNKTAKWRKFSRMGRPSKILE